MKICEERNISWEDYWKESENLKMYMCHGKDNIPFHTMILPGLLLALDENYHLPDVMVASQYVNIDSEKISKSKGNGITILDMIKEYDVDSLRYYMIAYGPENADINFTMENYINVHNSDLVNKFGNFVNRTLNFKGLETIVSGKMDDKITDIIVNKYDIISKYIEKLEFRKACAEIIDLIEIGNKYYDERKPWIDYKENIELVALGTIADVVSLTGENRILVKEGMARFLLTPIKGLSALLRITGLVNEDTKEILHADYISFGLAPRLNAAGRITHAKYGVELMTTESGEEAEALAQILCDTNIERQHIEREIYEEALQRIAELQIQDDLVLVIDGKDWHPGVIGIVASRILELYHRPVLVITVRNGVGKGSCRSISAFNIHEALEKMAGFLIQYGGHKMAAGFSIPAEKISEFRKRINDYAKGIITVDDRIPVLELEESLPLDEVNIEFIRSLDLLEPYGSDNPKPLFASFRVFVETARRIGNDRKHFKCRLSQNREPVEAIFWGIGDKDPCCPGDIVDIVYEPEIHDWYGEHVQLICKDIRPVKDYFLTRDFLIDVFVRLRELIPNSKSVAVFEIQNRLKRSFEGKYSRQCLCTALSVFEELNILYRFNRNGVDYYRRKGINKKLDLLSSSIYRKYRK